MSPAPRFTSMAQPTTPRLSGNLACFLSTTMAIGCQVLLQAAARADTLPQDRERIEFIISRQERLLSQVSSFGYSATEVTDQPARPGLGLVHTEVQRTVLEQGALRATTAKIKHTFKDGHTQESTVRTVLTGTYFATGVNGTGPTLYVHSSIDSMTKKAKVLWRNDSGRRMTTFGFGDGQFLLAEWFRRQPAQAIWTARESTDDSGSKTFVLRLFRPDFIRDTSVPYYEWYINPEHDFIATRVVEHQLGDGHISREVNVTARNVAQSGISLWLPALVREDLMDASAGVEESRTFKYDQIRVNPPVSNRDFSLAHMECRDGSLVPQIAPNGVVTPLVMLHDEAVPMDVAHKVLAGNLPAGSTRARLTERSSVRSFLTIASVIAAFGAAGLAALYSLRKRRLPKR